MKVNFQFTLPDDDDDFRTVYHANNFKTALEDISNELRQIDRYEPDKRKRLMRIENVRERFYQILRENDVELF